MKIAIVGPAHPYKGGGARHTTELAHRLAAAGHDVIIESWRAQYPARLYPGQQTVDVAEGAPYPRTRRRLAWYRPDGWLAEGRRLRTANLVVFAYLTPLQAPPYLAIMSRLGGTKTAVIGHNVLPHERRPGDIPLTRALLSRADTVITHSAAQAAQARDLAPAATVRTVAMPPHLPAPVPKPRAPNGPGYPPPRPPPCPPWPTPPPNPASPPRPTPPRQPALPPRANPSPQPILPPLAAPRPLRASSSSASSAPTRASTSCSAPWLRPPRTSPSPWPASSGPIVRKWTI